MTSHKLKFGNDTPNQATLPDNVLVNWRSSILLDCSMSLTLPIQPQLDGELLLAPGFASPPNLDYAGYHGYIDENLPPESPYLYGLHPNAEIGFLTTTSENLFRTVLEMQPRDSSGTGASGTTREEKVSGCVLLESY